MRGRARLAFRSKADFCVPGVVVVLVLPVKTNVPLEFREKTSHSLTQYISMTNSDITPGIRAENVPGVFVAEKGAVLTLLGFPPSVVGFCGVLEATQGDMRAGVFTKDFLYSLS